MKKLTLIFLLIINFTFIKAAENYKYGDRLYVASPKGLNLRVKPSSNSKILVELKYNSQITIIDKLPFTKSFTYSVTNFGGGTLQLKGHWVKVSFDNLEGYVFDGNLTNYKYDAIGTNEDYDYVFGKPKVDTTKSLIKALNGIEDEEITIRKIYPKILQEVVTIYDGCLDVLQTFINISFNEAYWLINKYMQDAEAINEIKITKEKNSVIFIYSYCI